MIITIIVMLILVGVTINVAVNSGLFGKSSDAAMETEKHSISEQMISAMILKDDGYINVKATYDAVEEMLENQGMTVTAVTPSTVTNDTTSVILEVQGKRGTYTYSITSSKIDIVENGITVSATPSSINVEGIATLSVTKTGISSETSVTYTSSDTSVATVSGTTVTGVAQGTATITATCTEGGKEYTSTCTVTVTAASGGNLRKYVLGEQETGIPLFVEIDAENGILSMDGFAFQNNNTITNAASTLHYVVLAPDTDYGYVYFKYDEDGKYYRIKLNAKTYQTIDLDEIYTPSTSANIGRTLTYSGKSYTVIGDNGTELELLANYLSNPVTIGANTYADAIARYNSIISIFDSAAENATGLSKDGTYVKDIRSIGSSGYSDSDSDNFPNPDSTKIAAYTSDSAKASDLNFEIDFMKMHNAGAISASSNYWLASRCVNVNSKVTKICFEVRAVGVTYSDHETEYCCYADSSLGTSLSEHYDTYAVRPVVTLSSDAPGIEWTSN